MLSLPKKGKYQKYPRKTNWDRINAAVESQSEQIASLTKQMSDLMAVLASKPSGTEANTTRINSVSFPDDVLDINKEAESDIFHFLWRQTSNVSELHQYVNSLNESKHIPLGYTRTLINKTFVKTLVDSGNFFGTICSENSRNNWNYL